MHTAYDEKYWVVTRDGSTDYVYCYAEKTTVCPEEQTGWKCWFKDGDKLWSYIE